MDSSRDSNQPDAFHIRILSIISPQDFWMQKIPKDSSDKDDTVIRAGIYGLFPTRTQYIQQKDEFTIHKAKCWTHTTKIWFSKFMRNITDDVLFVPKVIINTEHSTDGLSPVCMYGEIYIQKNEHQTRLLKVLYNQRLAYKSDTQFKRYLEENRLPVTLTQEQITMVKCEISKEIPDFEVGDHIRYRQQQMNKYRPVGDRENQAKVAKETLAVALRYFQRSKQEIDAILKRKEDDWNVGVDDVDQCESVYGRKDVIEKRRQEEAQAVPAMPEEFTVIPPLAEIDLTEICENYSLHPPEMSKQNQIILKKDKCHYMPPQKNCSISKHPTESTPEDRLPGSSFDAQKKPDISACILSKPSSSKENRQNYLGHSEIVSINDTVSDMKKLSPNKRQNDNYISNEQLLKSSDFTESPKTLSDGALDFLDSSNHYKAGENESLKTEIKSSSPEKSLLYKSFKDYFKEQVRLPPLWVKHQDKGINEKTAAELKNMSTLQQPSNQPDIVENFEIISPVNKIINNAEVECTSKTVDKKFIILKDSNLSDDDNDPDIVEDEFDEDHFNSTGSSVASFESSFSKFSISKNQCLSKPLTVYNMVWNALQTSDIDKNLSENINVAETPSDISCSAEKDCVKINDEIDHIETVKEDDIRDAMLNMPPRVQKETSNCRLSGMGLVERIIEPKVMVHSPNTFNVGLWTTMLKTAFPKRIRDCLSVMKITTPNRLQMAAWPAMMRGLNCTIIGPANSGKTLGVLAPLCSSIADFEHVENSHGPIGMIIVPNVRTAFSVYGMCSSLLQRTKLDGKPLKILRVNMARNITILKVSEGCDILIMTSTAFLEFSDSKLSVLDLSRLKILLFDDADVLYSKYNDDVDQIFYRCRRDKNFQFQVAFTAKKWMEQFRPLIKGLDIPVVCISAFQECVLYSKVEVVVKMTLKNHKSAYLIQLLQNRSDTLWKLIVLCINDEEVFEVYETLKSLHYSVRYLNTLSNTEDVQSVHRSWDCGDLQALVCCDMNLSYINAMNATWLINYSLPNKFSTFNMRFVVMLDSYPNIFTDVPSSVPLRIHIFVDSDNSKQLPKIVDFTTRCGTHIPDDIKSFSEKIFNLQDKQRAYNGTELCDELLSCGKCDNLTACDFRHSITDRDIPAEWIPSSGTVVFKVLKVHRPDLLSVQLIESASPDGTVIKYEQKNTEIELTAYFAVEDNVRAHGNVEVNQIAAIKVSSGTSYERCQVVKICTRNSAGGPDTIVVNLLEKEIYFETKAYNLYYLPDHLKNIISRVVLVRITGLKPNLGNVFWSASSVWEANKILTDKSSNYFTRGNIVLAIGRTLFFQTIQCCQKTNTEELVKVELNYSEHMTTNRYVCENPGHLILLRQLCDKFNYKYPTNKIATVAVKKRSLPEPQWAHLDENEYHEVYISSVVSPDQVYVRAVKQQDLLDALVKDLQVYVEKRQNDLKPWHKRADWNFNIGTYCLAKFPDDELYCRARIEKVMENKTECSSVNSADVINIDRNSYECFFVDFGDWQIVNFEDLCPISPELITRLPFLVIECRIYGLKPKNGTWCEDSSDVLYDLSFEDNLKDLKLFYARFHKKETAHTTLGSKYAILLYDSSNNNLINDALLAKDQAVGFDDELKLVGEDKIDLEKWLNLRAIKNMADDDFDLVSDQLTPIPDFFLKSDKNISYDSSLSSYSDLSDADLNKVVPFGENNNKSGIDFNELDFSFENWDCQFDQEDYRSVIGESRSVPGTAFPKIMEDFEYVNVPSGARKRAMINEIIEPPFAMVTENVVNKQINTINPVLPVMKFPDENKLQFRIPHVLWYQTEKEVILKIKLIGVQNYSLVIDRNSVTFKTVLDDVTYEFNLDLFNGIVIKNSSHENRGSYIRVELAKLRCVGWYQLFKGIDKKLGWVSYDYDHIDDACDDDDNIEKAQAAKESMRAKLELIKRVHQIEMDSEDSDDETLSADMYNSKLMRMKRECLPFDPEDVCPDMKVLEEPLDFNEI